MSSIGTRVFPVLFTNTYQRSMNLSAVEEKVNKDFHWFMYSRDIDYRR